MSANAAVSFASTPVPTAAWAVCQQVYSEHDLLFDRRGRICRICDADQTTRELTLNGVWRGVASSPLLALTGTLALVTVIVLGPVGPVFGAFFGLAAMIAGLRALWAGVTYLRDPGQEVGTVPSSLLLASGTFGGLWGASLTLLCLASLGLWLIGSAVS
jgi:hypothetical protein